MAMNEGIVTFGEMDEWVELYAVARWLDLVRTGVISDDDGMGCWSKKDQVSNLAIDMEQVAILGRITAPSWATHVAWYSK
jgi:hypothetical protein